MRTIEDIKQWLQVKQDEAVAFRKILPLRLTDENDLKIGLASLKGTMAMLIALEDYITSGELQEGSTDELQAGEVQDSNEEAGGGQ